MSVRVGLTLPSFVEDPEIPIGVARAAEDAGLDAVFVFDHLWRGDPPNRRPALERFALLGAIAAETTRVRVGTLVARSTLRPAATLANSFLTAQRVSNGRLIAGIGAGDSQSRGENEAFGLEFGTLADRVMSLHDSVRATHGGGYPVWVGGHAAQVREIVVLADGWNLWGGTPDHFAKQVELVRDVAPTATITWGGLVLTGADDAAAQAKAANRKVADDVLVGGPARIAEQLAAFVERGAEWVILGPIDSSSADNAGVLGEVRRLLNSESRRVTEPSYVRATRVAYDTVAVDYAALLRDELAHKPLDRAMLGVFAELVRNAGNALVADIGCGPGRVTAYLSSLGCNAFGVDLSPAMIAVARESYPDLRFEEGSMAALDLANGALRGIVAWYSIIHTPPNELPAIFAEFRRVLAPDGHLLLAFQVGDACVHLDHAYGHDLALDAYRLAPDAIAEQLHDSGFVVSARLVREAEELEKTPQAYLIAELSQEA